MKKKRSDSVIDGLPQNQRDQIEGWLFEENFSYKDTQARALADLNVRLSQSALRSFFDTTAQERMLRKIQTSRQNANEVVARFKANPADMYSALVNIVGQAAFEASMKGDQLDPELVFNFTKLVMHAKKQALEESSLNLQRDKFQFDAAKAAMQALPALRKIAADNSLAEPDKIKKARQILFGELAE